MGLQEKGFTVPQMMLIAATRAAVGAGVAFLLSNRSSPKVRRGAGWALLAVGVATSIPIIVQVVRKPPVQEALRPAR